MAVKVFKRYERKYLITRSKAEELIDCIGNRIVPDSYCINGSKYHIYNIYYDTENSDIIRRSCEKPYFKEKLRLRAYDNYFDTGRAFLEIKRKVGKVVVKRRVDISSEEANGFVTKGEKPVREDMQKINELAYFISMYDLKPAVFISYDRIAFNLKDDNKIRLTFDSNIRTRRDRLSFDEGIDGKIILDDEYTVFEVKFPYATPFWLSKVLSDLNIYPQGFSKYGEEYKAEK
ncbi:MAG TPA: molecular chaperone, partial [Clostridiales bacterium]|nr:molecular chaperone [Clostridiales bacterium]